MSVFVVVPAASRYGIVFGKNSNRPAGEVQELVFERSVENNSNETKCTYITVPSVAKTASVILSKPVQQWGCEMGANEYGVVGGTVPVEKTEQKTGILAQDLLRLALERSKTAESAVDTISALLTDENTKNGFLLTDKESAWYMETAGKAWVAQKIAPGVHIFPTSKPITTNYDKSALNLEEIAKNSTSWNGDGKLSWSQVFFPNRETDKLADVENKLISDYFSDITDFGVKEMTRVLRDTDNRVSRPASDSLPTASSHVSVLPSSGPACHWFTATPDPTLSVFKPFIFTPNVRISLHTKSPDNDGQHLLYKLHAAATASGENKVIALLQEMEGNCLNEVDTFMFDGNPMQDISEADDLLKDCVETEVRFYK